MAEIEELEQRIKTALDRIGAGLDKVSAAATAHPPDPGLEEALEAEKMANMQLEERIRTLREGHEAQLREAEADHQGRANALEEELARMTTEAQEAKAQVRALRQSNQRLQGSLQTLREAGAEGMEPHLINHAMMSEIEAIRATRAVEQSELDEILGALKPLIEENARA